MNGAVDIHLFILCSTHYIMVLLNRTEGNSDPSCGEKSDPIGGLCDTDFVPIFGWDNLCREATPESTTKGCEGESSLQFTSLQFTSRLSLSRSSSFTFASRRHRLPISWCRVNASGKASTILWLVRRKSSSTSSRGLAWCSKP